MYRGPNPAGRGASYVTKVTPFNVKKLTVVGESPNSQGVEKYETQSGKRLMALMGGKTVPWHNIHGAEPPKWSNRVARARVEDWLSQHPLENEPLLLLGRRVAKAFGIPSDAEWLEWYASPAHRHTMILFPHPSGQNRWWNDENNVREASNMLVALVNGSLPHFEYRSKDEKT